MIKNLIFIALFCFIGTIFYNQNNKDYDLIIAADSSFLSNDGAGFYLAKLFEEKYGKKIKFINYGTGLKLFNNLMVSKNNIDIIFGINDRFKSMYSDNNLILKLPSKYNNSFFINYDYGYLAFVYNSSLIDESYEYQNYADFIINHKGSLSLPNPFQSVVSYSLFYYLISKDYIRAADNLFNNEKNITVGSWPNSYSLFLQNSVDSTLSYIQSPLYSKINENKENIKYVKLLDGYIRINENLAIYKNSKSSKDSIVQFIDMTLSKEGQEILVKYNWMFPVINIKDNNIVKEFNSLDVKENNSIKEFDYINIIKMLKDRLN